VVFLELPKLGISGQGPTRVVVFRCEGEKEEVLEKTYSSITALDLSPLDDLVSQIERAQALVRGEGNVGRRTALERLAGDG
jgi:hypothetical protein